MRWRWVGAPTAAATLALALAFELWLVVLAMFSGAAVLVRYHVLARRRVPPRLTAWAMHAPLGRCLPEALEHAIAVDLAVLCWGHIDCLARARTIVEDGVDDPWRRELATERLQRAQDLLADGCLVGVSPRLETPMHRLRRSAGAIVMMVLIALGSMTQSRWWLLPLGVVCSLLPLELIELHERQQMLPSLLADRSLQDPVRGRFVMPEQEVVRSLVELAGCDESLIRRAVTLLQGSENHSDEHALTRLATAGRLAAEARRRPGTEGVES